VPLRHQNITYLLINITVQRDLSVCRTVIIIGGLIAFSESGTDPLALPCPDLKRTTCNSYSYTTVTNSRYQVLMLGAAQLTKRFTWIDRPTGMDQYHSNNNNNPCAFSLLVPYSFIASLPPLHPPSHSIIIPCPPICC